MKVHPAPYKPSHRKSQGIRPQPDQKRSPVAKAGNPHDDECRDRGNQLYPEMSVAFDDCKHHCHDGEQEGSKTGNSYADVRRRDHHAGQFAEPGCGCHGQAASKPQVTQRPPHYHQTEGRLQYPCLDLIPGDRHRNLHLQKCPTGGAVSPARRADPLPKSTAPLSFVATHPPSVVVPAQCTGPVPKIKVFVGGPHVEILRILLRGAVKGGSAEVEPSHVEPLGVVDEKGRPDRARE
mmetsp:Transcript_8584/g.21142  ORF Transcript_8584/g.21142 Transcript_8584/m.21142 type:complete len:236 (-) Transcript_8584:2301-3008(-)